MLGRRVLTAAVGLPLLVAAAWWGPAWLMALLFGLAGLAAWLEYGRTVGRPHPLLMAAGLVCGQVLILVLGWGREVWLGPTLVAGLGLISGLAIFLFSSRPAVWQEVERLWLGLGLVFVPLGFLAGLAGLEDQRRCLLLFLLAVVFASDSGAYFSGRWLGRRKLCPAISPAKTWVGLWGGLLAGGLVGLAGGILDGDPADLVIGPALGLSLAVLAAAGDLIMSMVKRSHQIKDAGRLLPGHGGLLDRLDSFFLAAPGLYLAWRVWGN